MESLPDRIFHFSKAVQNLWELMNPCVLCPRQCKVYRSKGEVGFCGISDTPIVSSTGPHFGEESVLVGRGGSSTIFFAGCNLGCIFCQNYSISHQRQGVKSQSSNWLNPCSICSKSAIIFLLQILVAKKHTL